MIVLAGDHRLLDAVDEQRNTRVAGEFDRIEVA
jgi:hypothetical protein